MRKMFLAAALGGGMVFGLASEAGATVGYCIGHVGKSDYLTPVFEFPPDSQYVSIHQQFARFVENEVGQEPWKADCSGFDNRSEAERLRSEYLGIKSARNEPVSSLDGFLDSLAPKPRREVASKPRPDPKAHGTPIAEKAGEAERPAGKSAAEYEAEFQKKQADYERKLAEQKRQVEEFERAKQAVAQQKADQKAAAERAEAAYADALRQHESLVAEQQAAHARVLADYDRRNGLGAGLQEKASTDTDANRCVTTPELQENAAFKGNTAASIMNGCGKPIDVRICLMTDKGWNCGVTWGLASQAKWSWSSTNATGQVFVDAKTAGGPGKLASPQ